MHCCLGVQVGISSVWYEGNTCNMHLNQLAEEVKAGVVDAGCVGYRFNTVSPPLTLSYAITVAASAATAS